MLNIKIVGNFHVTNHIKEYLEKRLEKLEKLVNDGSVNVNVLHEGNGYSIEITLFINKKTFHIKEDGDDPREVIDKIADKIERQVVKHKEIKRYKNPKESIKPDLEEIDRENPSQVLIYYINAKPISLEEAKLFLNEKKLDFYPFFNDERKEINVIFKRKKGDYGLYVFRSK